MLDAAALGASLEHQLRRVARTIGDLDPSRDPTAPIGAEAMALALELRPARPFARGRE